MSYCSISIQTIIYKNKNMIFLLAIHVNFQSKIENKNSNKNFALLSFTSPKDLYKLLNFTLKHNLLYIFYNF